jgi:hypothetical protein
MPTHARELAWVLADVDRGPDWSVLLHRHLDDLYAALQDHRNLTEGDRGCYAEVVAAAPRLARGMRGLLRDHDQLVEALSALRTRIDTGAPFPDLRRCGTDLLMLLERHRRRGITLLYEAYGTDIGGET